MFSHKSLDQIAWLQPAVNSYPLYPEAIIQIISAMLSDTCYWVKWEKKNT